MSRAEARINELEERCAWLKAEAERVPLMSPLDGNDLMRLFDRGPGPWLRPLKEYLLGLVLDNKLAPDDTASAEAEARAFMAAQERGQEPAKSENAGQLDGAASGTGEPPANSSASMPAALIEARTAKRRQSKRAVAPETHDDHSVARSDAAARRADSARMAAQPKDEVQP